ncbi:MAG: Retaining alpha-galactosidase [Porphyromonadaceae bacterium CG2_30_38_12]|nr:MAG: Retaining alpha-galactosidase [Porphyromonadaceae bacterium CG2_30_38_12]
MKVINNMKLLFLTCIVFLNININAQNAKYFILKSPNGSLNVEISCDEKIEYKLLHDGDILLEKSDISMKLEGGNSFGIHSKYIGFSKQSVNKTFASSIYKKNQITDAFNEITLKFKDGFQLIFRAYDDGMAYRFVSTLNKRFVVENEQVVYNFPYEPKLYVPYANTEKRTIESQMAISFENVYKYIKLSEWETDRIAFSPLLVEYENGKKLVIVEADLTNYPGMFLYAEGCKSLKGKFAAYPKKATLGGYNNLQLLVNKRESYIAKYENGNVSFPWRTLIVSTKDSELANNDMVYKLATPSSSDMDFTWVKPGKVAWDWWNDWNIYGVEFKSGINNDTYKYYIDFASKYGIEYIILDEGWSVKNKADLYQIVPEINLKELITYSEKKNVGLILWAGYAAFEKDIEGVCKHYSEMGIKGFKVDFMERDDQVAVNFHYRAAKIAAQHRMLLDFHGTYKPTGLQRTFPNVINVEAVYGLEQMKWAKNLDMVSYDVTMPFIRMIAGPVDYTQGAMSNATKENYRPSNSEPMSQGTRCRQLAEYIVFESPLNMLCDNPSNYMREPTCTKFIAEVPTVWDSTIVLDGKVAEYIAVAREKGSVWYVGAMTNWDARNLNLDLSFLGAGNFKAVIFKDGVNADKAAHDYKKVEINILSDKKLNIQMAPGGGFAMKISKL